MASEIENLIEIAAIQQGITLRKLSEKDVCDVEDAVCARYVKERPRVWWLGLSKPAKWYETRTTDLRSLIPSTRGTCWFIPEINSRYWPPDPT